MCQIPSSSYSRSISEFCVIPPDLNFNATDNRKWSTCLLATIIALDSRRETYVYCLREHTYPRYIANWITPKFYRLQSPVAKVRYIECPRVRSCVRARVHAHERVPLRRASLSPILPPREGSSECRVWCAGTNVQGWVSGVSPRTDDYAMPTDRLEGQETQLQWSRAGRSRVERRPLGSGAGEGQKCILKGSDVFQSVASRCSSNSACLPKGPIVVRPGHFHTCHDFLPITRVHQSRSWRFLVCFCSGKAFWDPPSQDQCLLFGRATFENKILE